MRRFLLAGLIAAAATFALVGTARLHHNLNGKLPLIPNTPAVQEILRSGELAWCTDGAATSYPGFVSQLTQTMDAFAAVLGVRHRRVAYGTPSTTGCQVQHSMPSTHGCSACGAWVYYANWPVLVEYNYRTGYTDWKTTIGHEFGHIAGLHEAYDDINFRSHILTYGVWASPWNAPTVMDIGSHVVILGGVWSPTAADLRVMSPWLWPEPLDGGTYRADLGAVFYGPIQRTSQGFQPGRWVAVFVSNVLDPELRWIGVHGPVGTESGIYGVGVPELPPCSALWIASENALSSTWGRNPVWVGDNGCAGVW
jgi:hypothetical protein